MEPLILVPQNAAWIAAIIPALNEEASIALVVSKMPRDLVRQCIVVNNGSTDATAARAAMAGALVIDEPAPGYGRACAAGVRAADPRTRILLFMDGDGSDLSEDIASIVQPLLDGQYDFVIGSRLRGKREPGSLLVSQIYAGRIAGWAMRVFYGVRYTDMGPLRAITRNTLEQLHMSEMTYGWNLEMQMKAARAQLRILEVPVSYRHRQGGTSKVAGSFAGSIKAAWRISLVLLRIGLLRVS